jgi:hypothetical protein
MHRTKDVILLVFLFCSCAPLFGQIKPVVGRPVEILYRPDPASPLAEATSLQLVYVYNYWGSRMGTRLALLENVLRPDTARVRRIDMKKTAIGWSALVDTIPSYAAVLSYYITDGVSRDDNGERTYAWYVHTSGGKPVPNARFFMNYFLELGRENIDNRVKEAEDEILSYPENYKAYTQFFTLLFEQGKGNERTRNRIIEKLNALESAFPDNADVLNLAAHTYYYILRDTETGMGYRNRISIPKQWPDVVTMFDRDQTIEQQRRVAEDRKQRREALLNTQILDVQFMDFDLRKLPLRLDSGCVQVITFWATTSDQSRRMLEPLGRIHQRYTGTPLKISLVNVDPDHKIAAQFLQDAKLPFQQRINFGATLIELGVDGIPHTIIVDQGGFVRKILVGFTNDTEQELNQILDKLLRQ